MNHLYKNHQKIVERIKSVQSKNSNQKIQLIAVSKTKPGEMIEELYTSTKHQDFGENYVQEGLEKIEMLRHLTITWHFIGPLQSNKAKIVAQHFHWIHTIDSLALAQKLITQIITRKRELPPLQACLQINIDHEETKSGFIIQDVHNPVELFQFMEEMQSAIKENHIVFRGIMVIPDAIENQQGDSFIRAKKVFDAMKNKYPQFDTLSMGMSQDLELAIKHGATCIRVGSDLFGNRN